MSHVSIASVRARLYGRWVEVWISSSVQEEAQVRQVSEGDRRTEEARGEEEENLPKISGGLLHFFLFLSLCRSEMT